ncbi:competence type IV pilus minor pilin ComGD [Halolactibacillus halophilus]|nr:competence type IV pilus minor pilin ComGD [Halolactibacillus halophilus]
MNPTKKSPSSVNNKEAGFTLIEVMIVLFVIQILLSIGFYALDKSEDKQNFNRWYAQFELDILYLQKRTSLSENRPYLHFNLPSHSYTVIINTHQSPLLSRTHPEDWKIVFASTKNKLAFNKNGQFIEPGTIKIETNYYVFTIVFPFGKGRCYVTYTER